MDNPLASKKTEWQTVQPCGHFSFCKINPAQKNRRTSDGNGRIIMKWCRDNANHNKEHEHQRQTNQCK